MTQQLGFGFDEMAEEQRTAHLPATIEEAISYYRQLIEKHNAAMLAGDVERTMALREEAVDLAVKLNGGELLGINGGEGSPVDLLKKATAAEPGTVPLWGQTGDFVVKVGEMPIRIELEGMYGLGGCYMYWPGFGANVVDTDKPFLSETGYRSFHGAQGAIVAGLTPDRYAAEMCKAYVAKECKGKVRRLDRSFAERINERREQGTKRTRAP